MIILNGATNNGRRLPSQGGFCSLQSEGKEGCTMVTYADLIQIGILIVAVLALVYTIVKDAKK